MPSRFRCEYAAAGRMVRAADDRHFILIVDLHHLCIADESVVRGSDPLHAATGRYPVS
jgi:hypothetical protein